jgi:ABC-type transport system substrate-binding protein
MDRMQRIRIGVAAALVLLALGLALAPDAAAQQPTRGGKITVAVGTDPYSPGPYVYGGGAGFFVNGNIYNSLLRADKDGKLVPDLTESYSVAESKVYTFKLHRGVTFHEGGEATAEDVKWSYELYMGGKAGATRGATLKALIDKIEVVDRHTVRITLKDPNATFLQLVALRDVPIVSKAWVESGKSYRDGWNGTGPFRMAEAVRGERYRMVRNERYFKKGLPYLDEITVRVVSSELTRAEGVRSGQFDVGDFLPWEQAPAFTGNPALRLEKGWTVFNAIVLNHSRPPFTDARVRQAVAWAIDRPTVNTIGHGGLGLPIGSGLFQSNSPWFCKENADLYGFDPARAKALLREAGHPGGVTMNLVLAQFQPYLQSYAVVEQNLKEAGIQVKVIPTDTGGMAEMRTNGKYDALWTGTILPYDDPDAYSTFFESTGGFYGRPTGFKDPALDKLFADGRRLLRDEQRKPIYCQLERRALEGAYWVFITWRPNLFGVRSDLKGFTSMPGPLQLQTPILLESAWLEGRR